MRAIKIINYAFFTMRAHSEFMGSDYWDTLIRCLGSLARFADREEANAAISLLVRLATEKARASAVSALADIDSDAARQALVDISEQKVGKGRVSGLAKEELGHMEERRTKETKGEYTVNKLQPMAIRAMEQEMGWGAILARNVSIWPDKKDEQKVYTTSLWGNDGQLLHKWGIRIDNGEVQLVDAPDARTSAAENEVTGDRSQVTGTETAAQDGASRTSAAADLRVRSIRSGFNPILQREERHFVEIILSDGRTSPELHDGGAVADYLNDVFKIPGFRFEQCANGNGVQFIFRSGAEREWSYLFGLLADTVKGSINKAVTEAWRNADREKEWARTHAADVRPGEKEHPQTSAAENEVTGHRSQVTGEKISADRVSPEMAARRAPEWIKALVRGTPDFSSASRQKRHEASLRWREDRFEAPTRTLFQQIAAVEQELPRADAQTALGMVSESSRLLPALMTMLAGETATQQSAGLVTHLVPADVITDNTTWEEAIDTLDDLAGSRTCVKKIMLPSVTDEMAVKELADALYETARKMTGPDAASGNTIMYLPRGIVDRLAPYKNDPNIQRLYGLVTLVPYGLQDETAGINNSLVVPSLWLAWGRLRQIVLANGSVEGYEDVMRRLYSLGTGGLMLSEEDLKAMATEALTTRATFLLPPVTPALREWLAEYERTRLSSVQAEIAL